VALAFKVGLFDKNGKGCHYNKFVFVQKQVATVCIEVPMFWCASNQLPYFLSSVSDDFHS